MRNQMPLVTLAWGGSEVVGREVEDVAHRCRTNTVYKTTFIELTDDNYNVEWFLLILSYIIFIHTCLMIRPLENPIRYHWTIHIDGQRTEEQTYISCPSLLNILIHYFSK